jgi:hypothetical protein
MLAMWAALRGLAGGMCVEALELYACIRRKSDWSWRYPINQNSGPVTYLLSVAIRAGIGAVVAAAGAASGQVGGAFGALALGIAAPLVIEKLARTVPLEEPEPVETEPTTVTGSQPSAVGTVREEAGSAQRAGGTDAV